EQEDVTPSRIPEPPSEDHPEARMWYALAVARLGKFRAIDRFLGGDEPEPPMFYGAPWTPYARIAAMRPLPSALHAHLCAALPGADRVDDPSRARMARIIVWAATGSADAEGESNPQAKISPIGTPLSPGATAPDAAFAAAREFFQRSAGRSARID